MDKLHALILSPDPRVHGGVSTFIELMKTHLKRTRSSAIWIGSIQGEKESILKQLWRLVSAPLKVACFVLTKKPDVLHINPSLDWKSVLRDGLILLVLRLIGYKHVLVYFHGWEPQVEQRIAQNRILCRVFIWLLNGTAKVLVLSPEFRDALLRMGLPEQKVDTTRTMFDGQAILKAETAPATRHSILFMSRFVKAKGIFELVEGFARVSADFPDFDLIMAGDGPDAEELKKRVAALGLEKRVLFPGYVTGSEKFLMLNQCQLYALPTYFPEGMPVALLEAMGAGKPVLTAKTGVIPYIITEPENGIVLEKVTSDTVTDALRRMLADEADCRTVGEHNRAYAWATFEAAEVTANLETVYFGIAEGA